MIWEIVNLSHSPDFKLIKKYAKLTLVMYLGPLNNLFLQKFGINERFDMLIQKKILF